MGLVACGSPDSSQPGSGGYLPDPSSGPEAKGGATDDEALNRSMELPGFKSWTPYNTAVAPPATDSTGTFIGLSTPKGVYMLEFDADVMDEATRDMFGIDGAPAGSREVRGWSNGTDNRQRLQGANLVPEIGQVINQFGGGCSGTLIGINLVRTAAHCVVLHTTGGGTVGGANQQTFNYRRDAGSIFAQTNTQTFYFGGNYTPQNCARSTAADYWNGYRNNFGNCTWADWAILVLPSGWWNAAGSVQWMGYRQLVNGNLGLRLRATGYPGCGTIPDRPIQAVGCVNNAEYEDRSTTCTVKSWTASPSKFKSDCDGSPGNSGGSGWDPATRQLIGHFQWEDCTTCAGVSAPNHFLGHDQWLYDFQNNLRNMFP